MAEPGNTSELQAAVQRAEKEIECRPRRLFHLAIPPAAFASVAGMLGNSGLAEGATRVIIEKPFGTDLESARVLNRALHAVFDESQVFRIDHFLGKEAVDDTWPCGSRTSCSSRMNHAPAVRADRRARNAVDRGPGRVLRRDRRLPGHDRHPPVPGDGVRGHEPPVSLSAEHLRDEKEKVFEALRPIDVRHVVRGQYQGYGSEPGVAADSDTETKYFVR